MGFRQERSHSPTSSERCLEHFTYVAFHAPSAFTKDEERTVVDTLAAISEKAWPIIVHPDSIHDQTLWRRFEDLLCIENQNSNMISIGCKRVLMLPRVSATF